MEAPQRDRRIVALIHGAMLLSIGIYGAVVAFYRLTVVPDLVPPRQVGAFFAVLAGLSAAQLAGAAIAARAVLRSRRGEPLGRVRLSFLLRGAAAEATAIYAFALGFLGAPAGGVLALFLAGAIALLASFPGARAWARAAAIAGVAPDAISPL